jgi:hypothetical protein
MTAHDDIQTVRDGIQKYPLAEQVHAARAALERLAARIAEDEQTIGRMSTANADLVARLERAEQELRFTHDRGAHLVYRREWEEFDRWQRWRDDERKEQERYQPTAQEFNDAMEGR